MKPSKEFLADLRAIVNQAFVEKNAWVGKTVQDIVCESIENRGLSKKDIDGTICLTINQAKLLEFTLKWVQETGYRVQAREALDKEVVKLRKLIEQAHSET